MSKVNIAMMFRKPVVINAERIRKKNLSLNFTKNRGGRSVGRSFNVICNPNFDDLFMHLRY